MEPDKEPMDIIDQSVEPLDFDDDIQIQRAINLAIAEALRTHKERGEYVVGCKDGKPVRIQPEDIVVPDVP